MKIFLDLLRIPLVLATCMVVFAACSDGSGNALDRRAVAAGALNQGSGGSFVPGGDAQLKERVSTALAASPSVDANAIAVTVNRKGEVKLDGVVPADQIIRADIIVRKVAGVTEVINALQPEAPLS
jgi:hyperosmotically inducible protein